MDGNPERFDEGEIVDTAFAQPWFVGHERR